MEPSVVKSQLIILEALKILDEKLVRLQNELEQIPVDRKKLEDLIHAEKEKYMKGRSALDALEKEIRKLESDLKDRDEKIRKSEGKLMEVKTNEEYKAATTEIEGQKQEKSKFEDKVLALISKAEVEKEKASEFEKIFKDEEKKIESNLVTLKEDEAKLIKVVQEVSGAREKESENLEKEVRRLYEKVRLEARGLGVAWVDSGKCLGCHVKIRPQLFNDVISFRAVVLCPTCRRLLVPKITQNEENNPIH